MRSAHAAKRDLHFAEAAIWAGMLRPEEALRALGAGNGGTDARPRAARQRGLCPGEGAAIIRALLCGNHAPTTLPHLLREEGVLSADDVEAVLEEMLEAAGCGPGARALSDHA